MKVPDMDSFIKQVSALEGVKIDEGISHNIPSQIFSN
jgi:hypothetical protein